MNLGDGLDSNKEDIVMFFFANKVQVPTLGLKRRSSRSPTRLDNVTLTDALNRLAITNQV